MSAGGHEDLDLMFKVSAEILTVGHHWEKQASLLGQKCLRYETDLSAEILDSHA